MRTYKFITVDVFTDVRFGGNPLAVFPDAEGISDIEMQSLAREFNLSEVTFVLPPAVGSHTARVRIFNPKAEMPFAGHPNVGTGFVLAQLGGDREGVLLFEEIAGLVKVRVERDSAAAISGVTIDAPQPLSLGRKLTSEQVAACAGIAAPDVIWSAHAPVEMSMGNLFFVAEVSGAALSQASPDLGGFRTLAAELAEDTGRLNLFLYARDGEGIRARMFAPLAGILEDPATGSAAAPLAGLLLSLSGEAMAEFSIRQGVEMGRPSLLRATAWRTADGIRGSVGGNCVPVLRGEVVL